MNEETPNTDQGLFESLRTLAINVVAIVHTRLDLFSTDLDESRERLTSLLVLMQVALFCMGVGVVLVTILFVVTFWESSRFLVLGGLGGLFLLGGAAAWSLALYTIKTQPRLFSGTLSALSKDK